MQIFNYNQLNYLFVSCISGLLLGVIYDLLCHTPRLLNSKNRYSFFGDFTFILIAFFSIFASSYSENFGTYRFFSVFGLTLSFYIYRVTIAKLFIKFELFIINRTKKFINYILIKLHIVLDISVNFVKIRIRSFAINRYKRKILKDAENGFLRKE